MAIALGWKAGVAVAVTLFAGWTVTHLAARNEAMELAKEYGHVRKGAINAPEVRIMTAEGAEKLIPYLAHVPDLYKVSIYTVPLTPDQLTEISKLRHVDTLTIGAELTDDDVALLSNMTWVQTLDLSSNPLTDESLVSIAKLTALEELNLSNTKINGCTLGELQNLPRLRKLRLTGTIVDDDAMQEVAKLRRLESLSLGSTAVTAEGLKALTNLHCLEYLAMPTVHIFGEATHENIPQRRVKISAFRAEFNQLKREKYAEAIARGEDVPDQFVSPFPDAPLE